MKILITIAIIIMVAIARMPVEVLPSQKVMGTQKADHTIIEREAIMGSAVAKEIYLKTGKRVNSQINKEKMDNYWGEGVSSKVRFPSHLAEWEEFRSSSSKVSMIARS